MKRRKKYLISILSILSLLTISIAFFSCKKDSSLDSTLADGSSTIENSTSQNIEKCYHCWGNWTAYTSDETSCEKRLFFRTCSSCKDIQWKQGDQKDHSWSVERTPPTCREQGYDTKTCLICGKTEKNNFTAICGCEWNIEYSYDNTFHWHKCKNCDEINEKEEHNATDSGECMVCGELIGETSGVLYDISADNTYAEVIGYEGEATKVRIAETHKGLPVKCIYDNAFQNNSVITSIVIPNSVTSIGSSAFAYCDRLTNVIFSDSITKIADNAFHGCASLMSIEIPDSVTSIGDYTFYWCDSLTSVIIPNSVTSIGDEAFSSCTKLAQIQVSKDNKTYKDIDGNLYTKDGTTLIQYAIGKTATEFTIPNSVTTIGDESFSDCESLTSVIVSTSVTSIGNFAFHWCYNLTNVEIPDSVTSIGSSAFYGCTNLTSVSIPDSIVSIGNQAFDDCENLQFKEHGNCQYLGNENNPYLALIKVKHQNYSSYAIHENTRVIADCAFYQCKRISNIIIPSSVITIGASAFHDCANLTTVIIPHSVISIGDYSFYGCYSLTSVEIGDSVTTIGKNTFRGCINLTSLKLGSSITLIDYCAFYSCNNLIRVYYKGTLGDWKEISIDSYNSKLTSATRYYYSESEPTTTGNYWHYDENGEIAVW